MSHTQKTAEAFARAGVQQRGVVDIPPYDIPRKHLPPHVLPTGFQEAAKRLGKAMRRRKR